MSSDNLGRMVRPSRWPTSCPVRGCDHPTRRPHHHHRIRGVIVPAVCECADSRRLALPGTRPPARAKVAA